MSIQAELESLSRQLDESRNVAYQAMAYSSDLGAILLFIEESFSIRSERELIDKLLGMLADNDLEAVACCFTDTEVENFALGAEIDASELKFIGDTRGQHRIFSEGVATVFNYDHLSCLVRDMPVENQERYGMLKDTIATLLNSVEARVKEIQKDRRILKTQNRLLKLTEQSVTEISTHFSDLNSEATSVLGGLMHDMEKMVTELGTSESRGTDVLHLIDSHISLIMQIDDRCKSVDFNFEELKHSIEHIATECKVLDSPPPAARRADGGSVGGSVDLF